VVINVTYKMVAVLKHPTMEITSGAINRPVNSRLLKETHTSTTT